MPIAFSRSTESRFFEACNTIAPVLKSLRVRLSELRSLLDRLLYDYCLDTPLCDHLMLADDAMTRFEENTRFLANTASLSPVALAYHYRAPIRVLFELHPPLVEMSRRVYEVAGLKKGEWETLQFRVQFALLDIEKILHHPHFIDLAMAVEEYVATAKK